MPAAETPSPSRNDLRFVMQKRYRSFLGAVLKISDTGRLEIQAANGSETAWIRGECERSSAGEIPASVVTSRVM
jgi:hypothetical protein